MVFIGAVAHDIRNPLTTIGVTCELLLGGRHELSPQVLKIVSRMRDQVARLDHLTGDLLLAAKEGRPVWEVRSSKIQLDTLASQILKTAQETDKEHRYSFETDGNSMELTADPDRIAQILTNLLTNAAKYSSAGSEIEVSLSSSDRVVALEVRDRGIGIPAEKRSWVYKPFARLKSGMDMSQGTGLGLATVKEIVESHKGSIQIQDRDGGGTCFRVELPRAAA
jgi:signal transduction histidine kinase